VAEFVETWSGKTGIASSRFCAWLGLPRGKLYEWKRRQGLANRHNASVPKNGWLLEWEKQAIVDYAREHPGEGYRRLAYMMIDADIAAASPTSVYRVLKERRVIIPSTCKPSCKGTGFDQPPGPHAHWHIDIAYLNIAGTFYYLCAVIDGWSRYLVHWEIHESMRESQVEIVLERARLEFPEARPRVISDNGSQFAARDFKEYIRQQGMTHVRTSPYYPQSNGKIERWNGTLKRECIRPMTPLTVEDARRIVRQYVDYYNNERLHSATGYVTPLDKLEGRAGAIIARRREKLSAAQDRRRRITRNPLTGGGREKKKAQSDPEDQNSPGCRCPLISETRLSDSR
jgi:transposase InsO family protein